MRENIIAFTPPQPDDRPRIDRRILAAFRRLSAHLSGGPIDIQHARDCAAVGLRWGGELSGHLDDIHREALAARRNLERASDSDETRRALKAVGEIIRMTAVTCAVAITVCMAVAGHGEERRPARTGRRSREEAIINT